MRFDFASAVGALSLFAIPVAGQAAAAAAQPAAGAAAAQPAGAAAAAQPAGAAAAAAQPAAAQPAAGAAAAAGAQPAAAAGAAAGGGAVAAVAPGAGAGAVPSAAAGGAIPVASSLSTSSPSTGKFPSLTGTWTTKSYKVLTGPGFYDPVNEKFTEPPITGISYSFTDDGWYEEAYYRAISNPTKPQCPRGVMQWQHGKYQVNDNGSISLSPIEIDGRQLNSDPCSYKLSTYERYHQPELFQRYEVIMDRYHNVWRLNLFQFNGAPSNPMYLAYQPPQMLPTTTLNPVATATGSAGSASSTSSSSKKKRNVQLDSTPLGKQALKTAAWMNPVKMWYAGLGMVGLGSFLYLAF